MKEIFISKAECGKILAVSQGQILDYVRNDGLPCVYFSQRTLRFELGEVKKWAMNRNTTRPAPKPKKVKKATPET